MLKITLFLLIILPLALSLNCQYSTESQCIQFGCRWINSTCALGDGSCLSGSVWSNSTNECIVCANLMTNNCSTFCLSYYFSASTNLCTSCTGLDSNCIECTSSTCNTCNSGFIVDPNHTLQCLATPCQIRYCDLCSTSSICYSCKSGYTVGHNGTYCAPSLCTISDCLYCSSNTTCAICRDGYALTASSSLCSLICNDMNCKICTTPSICSQCRSGYYYNTTTGTCKVICQVSNCIDCDLSTTCSICSTSYEVNQVFTFCNPKCSDVNCATCTTPSVCITCKTGYYLLASNNTCMPAICYIQNCLTCATATTCSQCGSIYNLNTNSSLCIGKCILTIPNCIFCETASTCKSCGPGYTLNPQQSLCSIACNVANCAICRNSELCMFCITGYKVSSDGLSCVLNCGISNCLTCGTATTCQTCNNGYTANSASTSCSLSCSPGYYLSTSNQTSSCQQCSITINFCQTCFVQFSNATVLCSKCSQLYYLSGAGNCVLCSDTITNCLFCSGPATCIQCISSYALTSPITCSLISTCNVANCKACSLTNTSNCLGCLDGYIKSSDSSTCTIIQCLSTQYYDTSVGECVCPIGTFLSGQVCTYCQTQTCASCNSGGCLQCKSKYYSDTGKCFPCPDNCINCTSGSSCIKCDNEYTLQKGKCSNSQFGLTETDGQNAVCPPGCSQCSYSNGIIFCTKPIDGYSFDITGNIIKCSSTCLTCSISNAALCTSCFGTSYLEGGQCAGCTDSFALTCPNNILYSTSCISGYSPINGVCKQCAQNCKICGNEGAGKCDVSGCNDGYTNLVGTKNCTKCYGGCKNCNSADPSMCTSCSSSDFLDNSSICQPCASTCLTCSSSQTCTSCTSNLILFNNSCYAKIGFPCSVQAGLSCSSCYYGYKLVSGSCVIDNSCNVNSTCVSCPSNYYLLSKKCELCQTNSLICQFCSPSNPTKCLTCKKGYYLSNSQLCLSCSSSQTGCEQCSSSKVCTKAANGYYLIVNGKDKNTGGVGQCNKRCATCAKSSACLTCATNYIRFGSVCIYQAYLSSKITLGPATGSNNWFNQAKEKNQILANGLAHTNQIISSLLSSAGYTDRDNLLFNKMAAGSIIIDFILATDPNQDSTTFSNNFQANVAASSIPDFQVLSQSVINNGFTTTSQSSSVNLGLILGISIPLLLLLVGLVIFIKIYNSDIYDQKQTEQTNKEIQDLDF